MTAMTAEEIVASFKQLGEARATVLPEKVDEFRATVRSFLEKPAKEYKEMMRVAHPDKVEGLGLTYDSSYINAINDYGEMGPRYRPIVQKLWDNYLKEATTQATQTNNTTPTEANSNPSGSTTQPTATPKTIPEQEAKKPETPAPQDTTTTSSFADRFSNATQAAADAAASFTPPDGAKQQSTQVTPALKQAQEQARTQLQEHAQAEKKKDHPTIIMTVSWPPNGDKENLAENDIDKIKPAITPPLRVIYDDKHIVIANEKYESIFISLDTNPPQISSTMNPPNISLMLAVGQAIGLDMSKARIEGIKREPFLGDAAETKQAVATQQETAPSPRRLGPHG